MGEKTAETEKTNYMIMVTMNTTPKYKYILVTTFLIDIDLQHLMQD